MACLLAADKRTITMELNLLDSVADLGSVKPREVEEVLEDPFALRFLPDEEREDGESRYYALGRSVSGLSLFTCFSTNGKTVRLITVREMSAEERRFYERKYAESI